MVWRLIRKNISFGQMLGYSLAALVGLTIIITALKFYGDVGRALRGEDKSVTTTDYMVFQQPVSMFDSFGMGGGAGGFSESEIEKLSRQPWVADLGTFTPAAFNVSGSVELNGRSMWSAIFLESVPDRFIDEMPEKWGFDTSNPYANEIPVIVPREYLALYNFGFAASRSLPQINEKMVSTVPITLYLNGNGRQVTFPARIVGFSDRLNTLAVPEEFMEWANRQFSASHQAPAPSRLIVEVNNPGDPAIEKYLKKNGIETSSSDSDKGRALFMLKLVTGVVVAIGAIISALSLFILMLSITLLLQKNREKNAALLLLGYSPWSIERVYFCFVGIVNLCILGLAIAGMLYASTLWSAAIDTLNISSAPATMPIVWGAAIVCFITLVNFCVIRLAVRRAF